MPDTSKTNKERLKEIIAGIEQGIGELFQSEKYVQYLTTMSRFHHYSVNNQMLIYMQKPNASLIAGFNKWRDQFERHVIKGEKAIQIIAPTPFKKKMEMEKIDADTGAPVLNADGTVVMGEKEIQIPMYKPVNVFDVGQTEGKPLPSLAADLTGNVERYDFFMEALRRSSPVPIEFEAMRSNTDGYFSGDDQRIAIREGMSETQTVVAVVHEITHSKLHNYEQERLAAPVKEGVEPPKPKDRRTEEVEAESVAYAVCKYYGIETGENSFGYIATWSKDKTLPELRASLETINKTASGLISDIDYHFRVVVKEYDTVLEAWAADYADYIRDNSVDSLILATREELLAEAVEDIKNGDSRFPRTALLDIEMSAMNPATALYQRLDEIEKNYPPVEHDVMYLLDGDTYLHIHTTFDGYDYTTYDKNLREIDGGIVDYPRISIEKAYEVILELEKLQPENVEKVSLDILDEIDAVSEQDIEQYKREHNFDQPEIPEQDSLYPMPDPDYSVGDLEDCGYLSGDMLPLSQLRALELYDKDLTIYIIRDGGEASMVFDATEIENHGGLFAVPYDEWELVKGELAPVHDKPSSLSFSEQDFLESSRDAYAIYQVKHGEIYRDYHFESLDALQNRGLSPDMDNYNHVYSAPFDKFSGTNDRLEALYQQFNLNHPADYRGHSMSVSDIIALKQFGKVSYHYCDSIGFQELPGFDSGKNPLRSLEDMVEQNDNQLDGIINNVASPTVAELEAQVKSGQSISLMDLARAAHAEDKEKRLSVLEKLRQQPPQQERKNKAPRKSAGMEL